MEANFILLGLTAPADLVGQDPYQMYEELCSLTNQRHDPCVIDVFIAAVRFMEDGPAQKGGLPKSARLT